MELLITLVVIIAVLWLLGLHKAIIRWCDITDLESSAYQAEHKAGVIDRISSLEVNAEKTAKTAETLKLMSSIKFD